MDMGGPVGKASGRTFGAWSTHVQTLQSNFDDVLPFPKMSIRPLSEA